MDMDNNIVNMLNESNDLRERVIRMEYFIKFDDRYLELEEEDRRDMLEQLRAMQIYQSCLSRRIRRINEKDMK